MCPFKAVGLHEAVLSRNERVELRNYREPKNIDETPIQASLVLIRQLFRSMSLLKGGLLSGKAPTTIGARSTERFELRSFAGLFAQR
jgi:hypothetical protein